MRVRRLRRRPAATWTACWSGIRRRLARWVLAACQESRQLLLVLGKLALGWLLACRQRAWLRPVLRGKRCKAHSHCPLPFPFPCSPQVSTVQAALALLERRRRLLAELLAAGALASADALARAGAPSRALLSCSHRHRSAIRLAQSAVAGVPGGLHSPLPTHKQ